MKYLIANWKMNLTVRESVALARGVLRAVQGRDNLPEIVLCPSYVALAEISKLLTHSHVKLGSQNAGPDKTGAFTGEVGMHQLEDVACAYAILGHSERRRLFNETDAVIKLRLQAVLASRLTPILCVGESAAAKGSSKVEELIQEQLANVLHGQVWPKDRPCIIAYEPVWAIGSGTPATVEEVLSRHTMIRSWLQTNLNLPADRVKVLYGGSVNGQNAYQFLREADIDGLLIGGASLKLQDFQNIIALASEILEAQL
jgi:triosephosphate isomerase